MSDLFLDAVKEPVFALLVTDPQFAQTANEFLQPHNYEPRHRVSGTGPNFLDHPEECPACAPHRTEFLVSKANKAHMHNRPRRAASPKVVDLAEHPIQTKTPPKGRRRGKGRSDG
jgi:hypothetical protein